MKNIVLIFALLLATEIKPSAQIYKFNNGTVSFFSVAPIENIDARSSSLNSELNIAANEIVFVVQINSFQFKKQLMQQHFNEKYIESDKYPEATYKGKINEKIDWSKNGSYKITSSGTLTVHGVSRERTDTAEVTITDGKIAIAGMFLVKVADHKITIPKLVFQNIAEVITVKFNGEYPVHKYE